jgi:2-haloacid dehalogenase
MHKPIEAVVFDVGGVLIDWNPLHLYRQLLPSEAAARRFVQEVCTPEWNRGFDEGRPMAERISELIEHEQTMVLAAGSKLGRTSPFLVAPIGGVTCLVTEQGADLAMLDKIQAKGPQIGLAVKPSWAKT